MVVLQNHRNKCTRVKLYQNKAINENFVDLSLLRWEVGVLLQKLDFFGTVLIFLRIWDHNEPDQMTYTVVKIIFFSKDFLFLKIHKKISLQQWVKTQLLTSTKLNQRNSRWLLCFDEMHLTMKMRRCVYK